MESPMSDYVKSSLDDWAEIACPVGGFLTAVLENNLVEAMGRADMSNRHSLFSIVTYAYNELPADCWGSKEKVEAWRKLGGLEGLRQQKPLVTEEEEE